MSDKVLSGEFEDYLEGRLTTDFVRKVFPIAPSLRRRYAPLFEEIVESGDLKNDDRFYHALAEGLSNLRWLDRIEDAFQANGPKDHGRSFVVRAMRWLRNNTDLDIAPSSVREAPPEDFEPGSAARELFDLVSGYFRYVGWSGDRSGVELDDADELDEEPEWIPAARAVIGPMASLVTGEVGTYDRAWLTALREEFDDFEARYGAHLDEIEVSAGTMAARATLLRHIDTMIASGSAIVQEALRPLPARLEAAGHELVVEVTMRIEGIEAFEDLWKSTQRAASEARAAYEAVAQRAVSDPRMIAEASALGPSLIQAEEEARSARQELAGALTALLESLPEIMPDASEAEGCREEIPDAAASDPDSDDYSDDDSAGGSGEHPDRGTEAVADSNVTNPLPGPEAAAGANADRPASEPDGSDAGPETIAVGPLERPAEAEDASGPQAVTDGAERPLVVPELTPAPTLPAVDALEVAITGRADEPTVPLAVPRAATGAAADIEEILPAVWGGPEPLDGLLAGYLDRGEPCFAWRLADLAAERRFRPGIPPAVLKAAVASSAVSGPYETSTQQVSELLAEAEAAVEAAEATADDGPEATRVAENARTMFFAALLRPAILAPDTNARIYIAALSMRGALAGYQPLQKALGDLGFEFRPTADELADVAGRTRNLQLPAARDELREWVEQARQARNQHVPTHTILHELMSARGEMGALIEAALAGTPEAEAQVEAFIEELRESREASESLFFRAEQKSGRPRKDRIRDAALDWACRKIQDGCQRLEAWLRALRTDRGGVDDRARKVLARQLGVIHKASEASRPAAAEASLDAEDAAELRLAGAVAGYLARAVRAFDNLVAGNDATPIRVWEAFNAPLLRLPGGCQPAGSIRPGLRSSEEGDPWREAHRSLQFAALMNPSSIAASERDALPLRRQEAAIRPAMRLLERLGGTLSPDQARAEEQAIAERADTVAKKARERVEAVRLDIAALESLDHRAGGEVIGWLDRLRGVAKSLNRPNLAAEIANDDEGGRVDDFPEVDLLLAEAQAFRERIGRHILADQKQRLEALAAEKPEQAAHVAQLIETLDTRDRVTVEDQIAQIRDGQLIPEEVRGDDGDSFTAFYPAFVQEMPEARDLPLGTILQALMRAGEAGPMDFSGLDQDQRADAQLLLETWRILEDSMRAPAKGLREALRKLVEALGFSSVAVAGENQLIPGRLVRCQVTTDVPAAGHWFLPPAFGSEAAGSYPVFLARSDVPDDQLSAKLADARRSAPCLLIVFGRLNRQRRESFARIMRRDKQTVLLIDETQVLFLAAHAGDRMERLIGCATPFGYLQPYTTDARSIPPEMFFGRKAEIAKIESRSADGCLVYGGRQLGKSALLNHIQKRMHAPARGVVAVYRDIEMVGRDDTAADRVWGVIGEALAEYGVTSGQVEREGVLKAIRTWLDARPERRVLMLLDETDNFLASENRKGYPNLRPLKDLMEGTGRRFKVVFAGLHNVCRTTKAPNSPLVHLGDPICVGPLNTSAENSAEARRMVTAPLRAAGYDYENPLLAWDILARVNHYPSLVQVFLKTLLESLATQPQKVGLGPRWLLAAAQIFESSSAQEINRLIRERFQWTLDLDPRYELIAKVLAMLRLEAKGDDAATAGLLPDEIAAEVAAWWPQSIRRLSPEDFHAFLDEMIGLGVLAQFGPRRDRYGLRSALVAQMLGERGDLEEQILRIAAREERATYDGAEFHRRADITVPEPRSPLADRSLSDLFDPQKAGVRILVAPPAVWGTDVAEALRRLGDGWEHAGGKLTATVVRKGDLSAFWTDRHKQSRKGSADGAAGIVILGSEDWDTALVKRLAAAPQVTHGQVLPVLIANPRAMAARILEEGAEAAAPAHLFFARPWSESMVRAWLDETGLEPLDAAPLRQLLLAGSGGAPARLSAARKEFTRIAGGSRARLEPSLGEWREAQRLGAGEVGLPAVLEPLLSEVVDLVDDGHYESVEMLLQLVTPIKGVDLGRAFAAMAALGLIVPVDLDTDGVSPTALARLVAGGSAGKAAATK